VAGRRRVDILHPHMSRTTVTVLILAALAVLALALLALPWGVGGGIS
jgi:hypothetical protein